MKTGIFVKVFERGEWVVKEFEFLTDEQKKDILNLKSKEELINWIIVLSNMIKEICNE